MRLHVLGIGKLKDPPVQQLCDEYIRRTRSLLPLQRIDCRDQKTLWARAESLGGPKVLLDERGDQLTTEALADLLRTFRDAGVRDIAFLIGDAHGFDDEDRARADHVLALSKLTLPHRLATLLLCEQLYRAGTILAGHPYHHS